MSDDIEGELLPGAHPNFVIQVNRLLTEAKWTTVPEEGGEMTEIPAPTDDDLRTDWLGMYDGRPQCEHEMPKPPSPRPRR